MRLRDLAPALCAAAMLCGCMTADVLEPPVAGGAAPPAPVAPPPPAPPPPSPVVRDAVVGADAVATENFTRVTTFFATDRNHVAGAAPSSAFGADPDVLRYGASVVSIPRSHRMGVVERPFIGGLTREDPARHFVLHSTDVMAPDAFYRALEQRLEAAEGRNALVFVHGYNVSFAEAAYRTAQMAYDLGFDGAPVFYSWPSAGRVLAYARDARNVEWSQANMERFLVDFFRRSDADNVYVVGHSMGNRALTRAIAAAARQEPRVRERLRQVVLAAPDIDAGVFRNQVAPALAELGAPVTLYASSGDLALRAAQRLYGGFHRAGQSGDDLVVVRGVDTIDASTVDTGLLGHSYYADETSILSDMFYLFRGSRPEARAALRQMPHRDGRYWAFRP